MYAAIDIHKRVFQAAVIDDAGQVREERFPASAEGLADWLRRQSSPPRCVAIEATTGWRWIARELDRHGVEVRLVDPVQARGLQGRRRSPKTDRLDARWLALLLARDLAPQAWAPPEEIQRLRDLTRLRKALRDDHTAWAQRLHALLHQEGWPCERGRLLTASGRRWLDGLALHSHARAYVERTLAVMEALAAQLDDLEAELRRHAHDNPRCRALMTIYGVGPILACHLLAEIGDAVRFRRPRQLVRAAGLDPVVAESGDRRRRGRLSRQGSPHLRWALVEAAQHASRPESPDHQLYARLAARIGSRRARLACARKLARRAYHVLNQAS
jgi:transposase